MWLPILSCPTMQLKAIEIYFFNTPPLYYFQQQVFTNFLRNVLICNRGLETVWLQIPWIHIENSIYDLIQSMSNVSSLCISNSLILDIKHRLLPAIENRICYWTHDDFHNFAANLNCYPLGHNNIIYNFHRVFWEMHDFFAPTAVYPNALQPEWNCFLYFSFFTIWNQLKAAEVWTVIVIVA